jgi:hypothetical protein
MSLKRDYGSENNFIPIDADQEGRNELASQSTTRLTLGCPFAMSA